LTGTKGKLERTAKGGLHGIVSQATALAAGDGFMPTLPTAIRAYLAANTGHAFYVSYWDRITRINAGNISAVGAYTHGVVGNTSADFLGTQRADLWQVSNPNAAVIENKHGANAVGPRHGAAGLPANASTMKTVKVYQAGPSWGAPANSINNAAIATRNNNWPSFVAYRFTLEDLTVSGRSYAQALAADTAEYTKQVLTAGGRYYGDTTPTDPATIA
jgi:hypothetical protein